MHLAVPCSVLLPCSDSTFWKLNKTVYLNFRVVTCLSYDLAMSVRSPRLVSLCFGRIWCSGHGLCSGHRLPGKIVPNLWEIGHSWSACNLRAFTACTSLYKLVQARQESCDNTDVTHLLLHNCLYSPAYCFRILSIC
jgi:hypothetical protein